MLAICHFRNSSIPDFWSSFSIAYVKYYLLFIEIIKCDYLHVVEVKHDQS